MASLAWNLFNTLLANSIKKTDRRLDEFKRLRTRLDTAMDGMREVAGSLRALSISASPKTTWQKQLKAQNSAMGEAYQKAQVVLTDLDRSSYVSLTSWSAAPAPHWDNALNSINGAYNPTRTPQDQKRAVSDCAAHLEAMIASVEHEVESEMKQYASVANRH